MVSENKDFVNWYKRIADTLDVNPRFQLPLYFILEGYPEKFNNLVKLDRSFGRIFHYAKLEKLKKSEIKEFYTTTFQNSNITIDEDALNLIVEYSLGIPLTMQYIGDCIYWI